MTFSIFGQLERFQNDRLNEANKRVSALESILKELIDYQSFTGGYKGYEAQGARLWDKARKLLLDKNAQDKA
jgi:hypothetical protein